MISGRGPHCLVSALARPHLYMDEQKRPTPERRRLSLTQAALGRPIPKGLVLALGMKAWSDDALAEYSMSHFVFVHWAARTSISERLSRDFRAAGTNERLDFNLSLRTSCDSCNWPCKMWSGSRELRMARESVAPWRRSSVGWMPERTGRQTDGGGRRHPVTMRKVSFNLLSMRRVCALRHQTGAQYSAVE